MFGCQEASQIYIYMYDLLREGSTCPPLCPPPPNQIQNQHHQDDGLRWLNLSWTQTEDQKNWISGDQPEPRCEPHSILGSIYQAPVAPELPSRSPQDGASKHIIQVVQLPDNLYKNWPLTKIVQCISRPTVLEELHPCIAKRTYQTLAFKLKVRFQMIKITVFYSR